jgi:hypothetical protein
VHRRSAFCLLLSALVLFAAGRVNAAPRDASASQKIEEAINKYYLATEFDKAEALLKGVLEACEDRCSPQVKGRAWMYVGIVRGSGRQDIPGAQEAFQQAAAYDPNVKLDDALSTPAVKQAFTAATGGGGAGPSEGPAPKGAPKTGGGGGGVPGNMECTPEVKEVEMQRPIPVACTTDEPASKVTLRYKPFGSDQWNQVSMSKKGEYWQGEIPCSDTGVPGKLRFYVQAKDKDGEELDSFGNKKQPSELKIVSKTDEDPPAYPGQQPPQKCMSASECPEEMVGTPACPTGASTKGRGNKGWGSPCDTSIECDTGLLCMQGDNGRTCESAPKCDSTSDCPSGSVCKSGMCDVTEEESSSAGPPGKFKKNLFGLHIAPDFALLSGKDVCGSADYSCFYGGSPPTPYTGRPQPGHGGTLNSGLVPGTVRILASYERLFTPNIGAEARAGFAFNGGPQGKTGPAFLPLHLEIRGKYWFGRDLFTKMGLRPYVALGGGIAQVDAHLAVNIFDPNICRALPDPTKCSTAVQTPQLDAYRKLGQAFISGGGGAMYAFGVNHGLVVNLNFMFMLPAAGFVIEPSVGYQLAL